MRNNAPRRYNSIDYRSNYSYMRGSAAPVFPQEEYSNYGRNAQNVIRRRKRKKPKEELVRTAEAGMVVPYQAIIALVIALVLSLCLLSINAQISNVKAEISKVNSLTQKCQQVNERLEVQIAETTDLKEVKKIATTRLGMQTAAPYQTVTINVPKDNNTIHYDDRAAEAKNKTFLEKIGLVK